MRYDSTVRYLEDIYRIGWNISPRNRFIAAVCEERSQWSRHEIGSPRTAEEPGESGSSAAGRKLDGGRRKGCFRKEVVLRR
ncbi:hypothetical protein SDC9_177138 [bioreactor metagenome]|uniref:Uncharacterized protein n=1 Tax=bioreactor metagenome TaxID=1076179 RepID=A0A645GSH0_9ZZZZ